MDNQEAMETQGFIDNQRIKENQAELENQSMSRKEKRKAVKKQKRKRQRTEAALRRRDEEEALLNDLEEQERLRLMEQDEAERNEREIRMWEERDRIWLEEAAERKRREEAEEEERRKILEELKKKEVDKENELNDEDDDWEYAEGPAEIIWQGNEIIVKKKRVRISKKDVDRHSTLEDTDRPTSNPLPPQSEAFSDRNASVISSQRALEEVSEQIPNFGTEQDKTHCPFHFKTGVCRFGQECNRLHYLPDKSHTLLMKNMYNGPGLAWEQDEGLEKFISRFIWWSSWFWPWLGWSERLLAFLFGLHLFSWDIGAVPLMAVGTCQGLSLQPTKSTYRDDEVERCYEEFYEDVHPEFQKHGEIVNFKVCRNGSPQLRGNVYVHYKSLDSAVQAYRLMHGRYFAGKQVKCEFVRVTKWRAAICGEYMKSGLKTCSRGMACNFIHCFRNPGGDYGWADWDKSPPRYWVQMMVALFGTKDDEEAKLESLGRRSTSNAVTVDVDRYHSRRSRSRERSYSYSGAMRRQYDESYAHKNTRLRRHTSDGGKHIKIHKEERYEDDRRSRRSRIHDTDSGGDLSVRDGNRDRERHNDRKSSRHQERVLESPDNHGDSRNKTHNSQGDWSDKEGDRPQKHGYTRKSSKHKKEALGVIDEHGDSMYSTHELDSDGGWSERDGDRNWHHDHMMKSSKNESKASEFLDNHRSSRYRSDATDSDGDSLHRNRQGHRYHNHRRKSSKRSDEVSKAVDGDEDKRKRTCDTDPAGDWSDGVRERHHSKRRNRSRHWSDDHKETEQNVKDKFHGQELDSEKPDGQRVRRHRHSSRKDGSSKEIISRIDFLSEDQKSNGNHEASSSGEHVRRDKSCNLDSRYNSDGNCDKQGNREPEKHRRSRRGKINSNDPDSGYYSGNTIDKGHSLESEKDHPDKRN